MLHKLKYTILFCVLSLALFSQSGEYFIRNYLPKEYNQLPTNNGIAQDKEGRIFIANQSGVLIYDGINWQIVALPDQITAFSIMSDKDGSIYVGADYGEFFSIKKNSKGKFHYTSLKVLLPVDDQPQEPIKQILSHNGKIYFLSADKLIEKNVNSFTTYSPKNAFHIRAFSVGNDLLLFDLDNNVYWLKNGKLVSYKGAADFVSEKAFFCYKTGTNEYALGFRNIGIYKINYSPNNPELSKIEKWQSSIDEELNTAEINNGYQLSNGNYIITSNKKGAFLINNQLKIVKRFNTYTGVYEDNVKAAFQDINSNLWLATYYGFSYIEINSKLYKYDRQNGISGLVTGACYYNNKLYLSSDKGVQFIDENANDFQFLEGFNKQTWNLVKIDNDLFIVTEKGIFIYNGKNIEQASDKRSFCLLQDAYNKNVIYAGTDEGVDVYSYMNKKLSYIKSYLLNTAVKSLATDLNKNIYFGCENNGIYYLNYYRSFLLDSIQKKEGLPQQFGENYVFTYKNKLVIGTDSGLYTVKKTADNRMQCIKSPEFHSVTKGTEIFRGAELEGDLICSQSFENKKLNRIENKVIYITQNGDNTVINNEITNKLKDTKANLITYDSVYKTTFICTDEGLFLVNKQKDKINRAYNFYLSFVILKKDTLVENLAASSAINDIQLELPYAGNQLNFHLGYNCFENKNAVEYSYYLEGSDDENYTNWSVQNLIKANNLHEGNYILHVKARCDMSTDIMELHIPFRILPPWYRTYLAYAVYVILFILFIVFVVKLNSKRLIEQNLKLEGIIKQRTATIEEQVELLEEQKHELQIQKKEITDSINYAQRIQKSILPSLEEINSTYHNIFIFFQPKDIVSGDFYWFHKVNQQEFLIACADCTGHGVPGAFMSTICSEKLTESSIRTSAPKEILYETNNAVKKVLKQDAKAEGTNKDGMEIALVKFNILTKTLTYSGANRALWIAKADSKEIVEIKPTKASVASFTPFEFSYDEHQVQLQENDIVYLTSDGYPDQFGGPEGKKFMTKNMKSLLKSIMHLPLNDQNEIIKSTIQNWKGNMEQVDDLLVIGLKA